ncbi:MAG: SLC13/DASS family transporter [Myxococcales bacterium]|nr:SLC13/DASS family transporter [Myxococcales bacterium]
MADDTSVVSRLGFWLGLVLGLGVVLFAPSLPRPEGLSVAAVRLVGVTFVVGLWWVTEALPLGATALIPAAAFPFLSIASAKEVSGAYMSPFIMLLLGGFLLALAVERAGVHRRLSLYVLLGVGTSPRRLVLGFTVASALLSMWISNTATTLIMMPIALAILERAEAAADPAQAHAFGLAVLLGTGYGASVGGMGTPVGTPPNLIAMGAMDAVFHGQPGLTFVGWAWRAAPAVIIIVPIVWLLLTRLYPRVPSDLRLGAGSVIQAELNALGPWRPSEIRALAVFGLAALLWVTRPDLELGELGKIEGWGSRLGLKGVHDGTIAIMAALIAFALPSGEVKGERLLPWATAVRVPWGLVLLFGGGIAISTGFEATGLSTYLGGYLGRMAGDSPYGFMAATTLTATFGTEIISNTALANITMPILAATAKAAGTDPRLLMVPVALACSCAFMMPAATGPNAIVFGTGRIRIPEMVKAGFFTNWAAWAVIFVIAVLVNL